MKTFLIHTMGCKSNQFESSVIKENLEKRGYAQVSKIEDADVYILNSCSVTHKSDNEAFYLLRSIKSKNPNILSVLTGCIAQIEKEKLLEFDFVDVVVGNDEKFNIPEIIESNSKFCLSDIMDKKDFTYSVLNDSSKTRVSLKIQDGCDNRCSYCIIPYARGNSRSANIDFVIDEINNFTKIGFKEVVFTGIHIGLWGKEFGMALLDLLKEVESRTSIDRYRLGSLYPNEIDDGLLEFLSKSSKFCPHFHLSLQSACDKTLESMNRKYKVSEYIDLIDKINACFDLPFIGSDIIAGFAGETESDFIETCNNLKKSGLSRIHTFPYSIRKGTVGASLPNQVEEAVKEARANEIKSISKFKYDSFINKNLGKIRETLIEKHADKNSGMLKGMTDNYLTVILDSRDTNITNTIVKAKLTHYVNGKLFGEIVNI